ncbi:MAG: hypothetical protein MR871_04875, partial [Lachnospiraceae bacterium]|nr:hypothetical protein [Lachnospiraceae bacterium]
RKLKNRRVPNGTHGGVRGRELITPSYSILPDNSNLICPSYCQNLNLPPNKLTKTPPNNLPNDTCLRIGKADSKNWEGWKAK